MGLNDTPVRTAPGLWRRLAALLLGGLEVRAARLRAAPAAPRKTAPTGSTGSTGPH